MAGSKSDIQLCKNLESPLGVVCFSAFPVYPLFSVDGRTAVQRTRILCLLSLELFIFRLNLMPLTWQGLGMSLFC